jgi:hypothetical protein
MERQIQIPKIELIANPNGTVSISKRHRIIYNGWLIDIDPKPIPFVSDGSSIPTCFYSLVSPKKTLIAGIVHDWLYDTGKVTVNEIVKDEWKRQTCITRKQADMVWKDICIHCGVIGLVSTLGYIGLRIGGWRAWNYYRKTDMIRKLQRQTKAEMSAERM